MIEKYGVDNPSKFEGFKEKRKQTKIKNGFHYDDSEWHKYKLKVQQLTKKEMKKLFEQWDGYDYYDGEYIKDYDKNDFKNYRTIDHKISISYGYNNNISPEIIGNKDNLCITKSYLNSMKSAKTTEKEFIERIKNKKNTI